MLKCIPVVFRKFSVPAAWPEPGRRASNARLHAVPGQSVPSDPDPSAASGVRCRPRRDSPLGESPPTLHSFHHPRQRKQPEPGSPPPSCQPRALSTLASFLSQFPQESQVQVDRTGSTLRKPERPLGTRLENVPKSGGNDPGKIR